MINLVDRYLGCCDRSYCYHPEENHGGKVFVHRCFRGVIPPSLNIVGEPIIDQSQAEDESLYFGDRQRLSVLIPHIKF
jgi:hypothetical protein